MTEKLIPASEALVESYEYDDRTVIAVDLGPGAEPAVDVVDGTVEEQRVTDENSGHYGEEAHRECHRDGGEEPDADTDAHTRNDRQKHQVVVMQRIVHTVHT